MTSFESPADSSNSSLSPVTDPGNADGRVAQGSEAGHVAIASENLAPGLLAKIREIQSTLQTVLRDKETVIESVLTSVLAGGSVLLEDVPGVGKTTLAKSLAAMLSLDYQRIQCTPDLLPGDILGGSIYQPATGTFEFRPGPIFCNLLIADEVNRASPRTQSALLEAMAESQVTIDGNRYTLQEPFIVIATQNPTGFEGTFPLPESQLDRFLMRLSMDYPTVEGEVDLLLQQRIEEPSASLQPIMTGEELLRIQRHVSHVAVDRKVAHYLVEISDATRRDARLIVGASPRGSKMLLRAAQARALLQGRDFVLPDDVQRLAVDVLSHRVSTRSMNDSPSEVKSVVGDLVSQVEIPV